MGSSGPWPAVASGGRPLDAVALNAGVGVNGDFTRDIPLEDDPWWSGAPAGC
jgi:hypothetical protein